MSTQTLTRKPLSEHIGLELTGIDLDENLSDSAKQHLRDGWIESGHHVILHYWLDRAVYRLSRPVVRVAARGLF